jgi:uncharacterized protein YaeQ
MALASVRYEYRIALAHVDRARDWNQPVILARHPSETMAHLTLRVLAFCLLNEERLAFGPGLCDPDAADLLATDLTGRVTTWIECGAASAEKLRKVILHNAGVATHVVLHEARRAAELSAEIEAVGRLPRGAVPPTLWTVDAALVSALAANEERRQTWTVTVVGDHLYVEANGQTLDGAVVRTEVGTAGNGR